MRGGLTRVLSHPICTRETVQYCFDLLRHPYHLQCPVGWKSQHSASHRVTSFDFPVHLFRKLHEPAAQERAIDFTRYLCALPYIYCQPLPESLSNGILSLQPNRIREGPLIEAVRARCLPLVRLLISNDIDPGMRGGLAVRMAIRQRDLVLQPRLIVGDVSQAILLTRYIPEEIRSTEINTMVKTLTLKDMLRSVPFFYLHDPTY